MRSVPFLFLLLSLSSCAVGPPPHPGATPPAARMSLRPEYRVFYDALADYGDWILIEPTGFVFRPRVNFDAWEPYSDGYWAPTDLYGWVWVSAEPYGWATYHYGRWFYDEYQGWVWAPGVDWGPAWVAWSTNGVNVGWAPLSLGDPGYGSTPVRGWSWIPATQIADPNLKSNLLSSNQADAGDAHPIDNFADAEGVRFNRGPALDWIEERTGPLERARIEDLVAPDGTVLDSLPRVSTTADETPPVILTTRRAGDIAARDARQVRKGTRPERLPMVRPFGVPGARHGLSEPTRSRGFPRFRAGSDTLR